MPSRTIWVRPVPSEETVMPLSIDGIVRQCPQATALAAYLGIRRPQALGHLVSFWWWVAIYAPTGKITCASDGIAGGADWTGNPDVFTDAMVAAGWLTTDGAGTYRVKFWGK